jgi:ribonuclease P protein component
LEPQKVSMRGRTTVKELATSGLGRITARPDYLAVAETGRKWVTPSFILQAAPSEGDFPAKLGFTVSKKVGNAVKRSRARRRLKEAARIAFPTSAPKGWGFVLIGRPCAVDYPFEKIQSDMRWALVKLAANADLTSSRPRHKRGTS